MGYMVGIVLALSVSAFARWTGFDRDRAFYPTVLIVIASFYVLFAVMGGSMQAAAIETAVMSAFVLAAVVGFKFSPWIVVAGLALHGIFDLFHDVVIANPGKPSWWAPFCLAYDVGAAACLAWLSRKRFEWPPHTARRRPNGISTV